MASIKVVKEYERAVIFRLGRLLGEKGPGIFFIIPIWYEVKIVDMRTVSLDILPQKVYTKDEKIVRLNVVINYKITYPGKALTQVENYDQAISNASISVLKDAATRAELSDFFKMEFREGVKEIINKKTSSFGIEVSEVEIKDVEKPDAWGAFKD
ncbi:MAG: SPFH domain-containing protein [Halobacteriota archaeon]|nr:SPFH domain-containing protein [Halobacteriota archaeon]